MATVRLAAASMLTTVSTVAETATNLVQAIGTSSRMLNNFVDNAKWQQEKQIKAGRVGFEDHLMVSKSIEIATSRRTLDDYITQNPEQAETMKLIMAELKEALA